MIAHPDSPGAPGTGRGPRSRSPRRRPSRRAPTHHSAGSQERRRSRHPPLHRSVRSIAVRRPCETFMSRATECNHGLQTRKGFGSHVSGVLAPGALRTRPPWLPPVTSATFALILTRLDAVSQASSGVREHPRLPGDGRHVAGWRRRPGTSAGGDRREVVRGDSHRRRGANQTAGAGRCERWRAVTAHERDRTLAAVSLGATTRPEAFTSRRRPAPAKLIRGRTRTEDT